MSVITLLSDWGLTDHYTASVKGVILSRCSNATIVDISHNISSFNVKQAAFVLKNSWKNFPSGTIHIVCINSIENKDVSHILVKTEGHYFICADNGLLSLVLEQEPELIKQITTMQSSPYFTFPERDRLAVVAAEIANGTDIDKIGDTIDKIRKFTISEPHKDKNNTVTAIVEYIDSYENVFLNITKEQINKFFDRQDFMISFRNLTINRLVKTYDEVPEGEACMLYASNGNLQIAVCNGKAASLLGIRIDDRIRITPKSKPQLKQNSLFNSI